MPPGAEDRSSDGGVQGGNSGIQPQKSGACVHANIQRHALETSTLTEGMRRGILCDDKVR